MLTPQEVFKGENKVVFENKFYDDLLFEKFIIACVFYVKLFS